MRIMEIGEVPSAKTEALLETNRKITLLEFFREPRIFFEELISEQQTILHTRVADLCWALGGIICNFTPILPYFEHWGHEARPQFFSRESNMTNVKHPFEPNQVKTKKRSQSKLGKFLSPKLSEDQKKVFIETWRVFVPDIKWRPKKKTTKRPKLIQRLNAYHSQIIGGDAVKLLGGYIPPGFGTTASHKFKVWKRMFIVSLSSDNHALAPVNN